MLLDFRIEKRRLLKDWYDYSLYTREEVCRKISVWGVSLSNGPSRRPKDFSGEKSQLIKEKSLTVHRWYALVTCYCLGVQDSNWNKIILSFALVITFLTQVVFVEMYTPKVLTKYHIMLLPLSQNFQNNAGTKPSIKAYWPRAGPWLERESRVLFGWYVVKNGRW